MAPRDAPGNARLGSSPTHPGHPGVYNEGRVCGNRRRRSQAQRTAGLRIAKGQAWARGSGAGAGGGAAAPAVSQGPPAAAGAAAAAARQRGAACRVWVARGAGATVCGAGLGRAGSGSSGRGRGGRGSHAGGARGPCHPAQGRGWRWRQAARAAPFAPGAGPGRALQGRGGRARALGGAPAGARGAHFLGRVCVCQGAPPLGLGWAPSRSHGGFVVALRGPGRRRGTGRFPGGAARAGERGCKCVCGAGRAPREGCLGRGKGPCWRGGLARGGGSGLDDVARLGNKM
jgi:hypothetical protein